MVLAPTEHHTPLGDRANTQETDSNFKCDERPKQVVQRLSDAEVPRFSDRENQCRMERLKCLLRMELSEAPNKVYPFP